MESFFQHSHVHNRLNTSLLRSFALFNHKLAHNVPHETQCWPVARYKSRQLKQTERETLALMLNVSMFKAHSPPWANLDLQKKHFFSEQFLRTWESKNDCSTFCKVFTFNWASFQANHKENPSQAHKPQQEENIGKHPNHPPTQKINKPNRPNQLKKKKNGPTQPAQPSRPSPPGARTQQVAAEMSIKKAPRHGAQTL